MASGLLANTLKRSKKVWIVVSQWARVRHWSEVEGREDLVAALRQEQAARRDALKEIGSTDESATQHSPTPSTTPAPVATRRARQTAARPASAADGTSSRPAA